MVASVSSIMCPTSAPIAPRTTRARASISSSMAVLTRSYWMMEMTSTSKAARTTTPRRNNLLFLAESIKAERCYSKKPKAAIWRIIWVIYSLEVSLQLKPSRCSTLQV